MEFLLLLEITDDLMAVLLDVLSARNMDPVVTTIGGFHDQLVKVGVVLQEVEPSFGKFLVGVGLVVIPIGIGGLGDVDVDSFAQSVLRGINTSYLDIQLRATIARADDDWLLSEPY